MQIKHESSVIISIVHRYGADIILRKRFEEFIARKQTIGLGTRHVPVICAVLEGGTCTIRAILQYLTKFVDSKKLIYTKFRQLACMMIRIYLIFKILVSRQFQ